VRYQGAESAAGTTLSLPAARYARADAGLTSADFKVRSIDLYVTSMCNRRCTYCFLSNEFLLSRQNMAVSTVRDIAAWASASTIEEITLLGGEPALHPEFSAIVTTIAEHGLNLRTVTNGSPRFRQAMANDDIASAFSRVAVSLDTPSATAFDALRGRGAFRDAMAAIDQLRGLGKEFDINYTVLRSTLNNVPQMLAFAEELGARRINMHWFSLVGRASTNATEEVVSPAEWRKVLSAVTEYKPRRGDFLIDCELGFAYGLPGEERGMCAARERANLQFLPDGSVFSCGMLVDTPSLAGYQWHNGRLLRRGAARTELDITEADCDGCPARAGRGSEADGPTPLCIYNRLARP
jgi:MoaA/NifB/PqqE/SkfB family radical SAM enzyme